MTVEAGPSELSSRDALLGRRVLVIGVGGLGCPALAALADSGATFVLADDDAVEESNLHRQILFDDDAIGEPKLAAARKALVRRGVPEHRIELAPGRFLPENARALARSADLVLEGSDNFATKFLAADAAFLEQRPIVQGAAVRFVFTALASAASGRPCYRCLFEDIPRAGAQDSCADAGVLGPVVGLGGAFLAELTLQALASDDAPFGRVHVYDGLRDAWRDVEVRPRAGCPLCGPAHRISEIEETRYTAPSCAA